jgi:hypothetical protein
VSGFRRFIDGYGFSWQAWELEGEHIKREGEGRGLTLADASPPRGWLYFFSRGTTLVLRDYPRDWMLLSWEELDGLRHQALVLGSDTAVRLVGPPVSTTGRAEARA